MKEERLITVWEWVGYVLTTFGLIVLFEGILLVGKPPQTVLGDIHPDIWWGCVIFITGIIFLVSSRLTSGKN